MKVQISSLTLTVCGYRPVNVTFDDSRECWRITSPACELSHLYPNAVDEVRWTLTAVYEFCKCLLVPVFDDIVDSPKLGKFPRLSVVGIRFEVINDSDSDAFALIDAHYAANVDVEQFDTEKPSYTCVRLPSIKVIEYFSTFKSAYDFCRYLSAPVFNSLGLKIDTEVNIKS